MNGGVCQYINRYTEHMQDGYDQTLSGLLRKRAELAGAVETARLQWEEAEVSLNAIDAAIRVFNPNLKDGDLPERRPAPAFTGGTSDIQRFLLDKMRRSGQPLRTLDAMRAVMVERGIDPRDKVAATLIRKRCGESLGRLRLRGVVKGTRYGSGSELEWRLIGQGDGEASRSDAENGSGNHNG